MKFKNGKFQTELNQVEKILKKLKLLEERNFFPVEDFDPAYYRNNTYFQNWSSLRANNIYDFVLTDNSTLHFKMTNDKLSFSFYECPFQCLTYKEFLEEHQIDDDNEKTFNDYYETYLAQCSLRECSTMIRYDFDATSYFEGLHPISHIHIGFNNQVRISVDKILGPTGFCYFILRQQYPGVWKELLLSKEVDDYKKFKKLLTKVHLDYWKKLDKAEFHLT